MPPTYKNIWRGSYDVWFCEQDRIDGQEMMKFQTERAEKAGFIKSEMVDNLLVWKLTEKGQDFIKELLL